MKMQIKNVSILGLGAEGSIAYAALCQHHASIRILARGERAGRLKREGITINGERYDLQVRAPGEETPPELLIVSVKSYQLEEALGDIAEEIGPDTIVMSLMNGISSENIISGRIGESHLIYSMSRLNAKKQGQKVEFLPVGDIYIGEKNGQVSGRIEAVREILDGDIHCRISREIMLDIWRKYMFNAGCNTIETILRCQHRYFQEISEAEKALECVMREIVILGNACGVALSEKDILALRGCFKRYASDGLCSMAQDLRSGRRSEIDMLIGEALKLGKAYGVSLPVCELVYYLVRTMEEANKKGMTCW